jgi:gliding motility-associated lipoprotein GldH
MKFPVSLFHFSVLLCLFLLAACGNNAFYEDNQHIPSESWKQHDTLFFKVEVADTMHFYDFYLNVRNRTDYRYRNLYLFITTKFPGGGIARDTVECVLAAPDGKWFGKGMGRIKDCRILFKPGVRFPHGGTYLIGIEQAMREKELKGISDIGIRIMNH